jgi:hypothetical protein
MTLDEFADTDEATIAIKSAEECFNRLFVAANDRCGLRLRHDWIAGALMLAYYQECPSSFRVILRELQKRTALASVIERHLKQEYIVQTLLSSDAPKSLAWEWIALHDELTCYDWECWCEDSGADRRFRASLTSKLEYLTESLSEFMPSPPEEIVEPEPVEEDVNVMELLKRTSPGCNFELDPDAKDDVSIF